MGHSEVHRPVIAINQIAEAESCKSECGLRMRNVNRIQHVPGIVAVGKEKVGSQRLSVSDLASPEGGLQEHAHAGEEKQA